MSNHFDTIIIGAGPAGAELASQLRRQGEEVALVEKDKWGGTCLHQGCIPTKALIHETTQPFDGDLPALFTRIFAKVDAIALALQDNLTRMGITLIKGEALIVDAHTIRVNGGDLSAKRIVFAGGSLPIRLLIPGVGTPGIYDSETIYSLKHVPENLAIVGGGYIGFEWAQIFMRLGSRVTIYEALPLVLGALDDDVRRRFLSSMRSAPLTIKTNARITSFEAVEAGRVRIEAGEAALYDAVLLAVGRRPVKIELPADVVRIGDAAGGLLLAHKAAAEAKALALNEPLPTIIPSVIYTTPEIATVGATEVSLKTANTAYLTYKLPYRANSKAFVTGHDDGFVKLIVDENKQRLLGVAILGYEAGDIINVLTLAIQEQIHISKLKRLVFPHPTIGEVIAQALDLI